MSCVRKGLLQSLSLGELYYHGHLSALGEHLRGRAVRFCVRHKAYSQYLPSCSSAHVSSVSHLCHFYAEKTRNLVIPKLCYICCSASICFISLSKTFKTEGAYVSVYICIHWLFSLYKNNILLENWKTEWINAWNTQFEFEIICGRQGFCKAFCNISIWNHMSGRKHFFVCVISTQKRDFGTAAVKIKLSAYVSALFR